MTGNNIGPTSNSNIPSARNHDGNVFDVVKGSLEDIAGLMNDNVDVIGIEKSILPWGNGISSSRAAKDYLSTLPARIRAGEADPRQVLEKIDAAIKAITEKRDAEKGRVLNYAQVKRLISRLKCTAFLIAEGAGIHATSEELKTRLDDLKPRHVEKYGKYLLESCVHSPAVHALLEKGVDPNRQYERTFPPQRGPHGSGHDAFPTARKETVLLGELRRGTRPDKITALLSHPKTNINYVNHWVQIGVGSTKEHKAGDLSILHYLTLRSGQLHNVIPLVLREKVPTNEKASFMTRKILETLDPYALKDIAGVVETLEKDLLNKIDDDAKSYLKDHVAPSPGREPKSLAV